MNDLPFQNATIAIVGVGLIGGSLGLAFKRLGIGREIVGISRAETLTEARALNAIDTGYEYAAMDRGIKRADLAFLCSPISRILAQVPQVLTAAAPGCIVTDVGSTKAEIVACAERASRKGVHFIGGHPMAGSEKTGVGAGDPFLFENALYVLTPARGVPDEIVDALVSLVQGLGARAMCMDAGVHDRVAAAVSHLPQLMATALVGLVGRCNEADGLSLQMAAGGFRDLTRIASSPYAMWRDICATNAGPIREMIDAYLAALVALREKVDREALAEDFDYANRVRGGIPKDSKGFLRPLCEILLVAKDEPGVIADAASRLSAEGINIEDIEVLKVREGEGGTIRMGFGQRADAARCVAILRDAGYQARLR